MLNPIYLDVFDLDDAWFQCLSSILDYGRIYTIDRGSYQGQKRLGFDFITVIVKKPSNQIIPIIPEGMSIPPPTNMEYVTNYMDYLLTGNKTKTEDYTYGERLVGSSNENRNQYRIEVNQIQEVIDMYKKSGYGTNQATMEIAMPSDIKLKDPPCLRMIDTRIREGKLHFVVYFRSWDLWGGFPANLGGIQLMKQYMAEEIGVEDGELIAVSKGLHLYDHCWDFAKIRTGKEIKQK